MFSKQVQGLFPSLNRTAFAALCTLGGLSVSLPAAEPGSVAGARETYKEYIEVRKLIGEERNGWQSQKASLVDMIGVLQTEIAQIEEAMAALTGSATTADRKRAGLSEQLETARAVSVAHNGSLAALEAGLKSLETRLPDPLKRELQPLYARLPDNPAVSRLSYSQRLQSAIGILAQVDKFNTGLKYVSEVKSLDGGSFEVQTLYFGLGAALFTDAAGNYTGYGHPGPDGWQWQVVTGAESPRITQAIDIYLSRKTPVFVSVPLKID